MFIHIDFIFAAMSVYFKMIRNSFRALKVYGGERKQKLIRQYLILYSCIGFPGSNNKCSEVANLLMGQLLILGLINSMDFEETRRNSRNVR